MLESDSARLGFVFADSNRYDDRGADLLGMLAFLGEGYMPVLLEGTAVVIRNDALDRCLDGGARAFDTIAPNAMSFGDGQLSQASFMSPRDAELFRDKLVLMGLRDQGHSPDLVVVDAHNQTVTPTCDWLQLMEYKGNLIASMVGSESDVVVAPETWDPESGPALHHMSAEEVTQRLEFVRREGQVDVYRDKESGQLLYSARMHELPGEVFQRAADVILGNMRHPGQQPPAAEVQDQVRAAIGDLQRLASSEGETWRMCFLLGKAWHTVNRLSRSIAAFERAIELAEDPQTLVYKEFAGILLESGATKRAGEVGEKAVSLEPDNCELLGNLSIAYLLDGRLPAAEKTIYHALSISRSDPTNRFIESRVRQIKAGQIPYPKSLVELEGRRLPVTPQEPQSRSVTSWLDRLIARLWKAKR